MLPNLPERIKLIEAAIATAEVKLQDAEGSQRNELEMAINRVREVLLRLKRLLDHQ